MSGWMTRLDVAVLELAEAARRREGKAEATALVQAEIARALAEGAPTAEVERYFRRRLAHHGLERKVVRS